MLGFYHVLPPSNSTSAVENRVVKYHIRLALKSRAAVSRKSLRAV